jgi:hypothetical protein
MTQWLANAPPSLVSNWDSRDHGGLNPLSRGIFPQANQNREAKHPPLDARPGGNHSPALCGEGLSIVSSETRGRREEAKAARSTKILFGLR